jgi:Cu/Ag efflux pump CusA
LPDERHTSPVGSIQAVCRALPALGLALVPLAIAGNIPGHEIEHPMAIVILGGLVTSTLLNLFVVPSLYLRFGRSGKPSGPDGGPVTAAA